MPDDSTPFSRRRALQCMAFGRAGTLFALSGGVLALIDPQPAPGGEGPGLGTLKVPADELAHRLGMMSASARAHPRSLVLSDTALA